MEMSDEIHASAFLPLVKEPGTHQIVFRMNALQGRSGCFGEGNNLFTLPWVKTQIVQPIVYFDWVIHCYWVTTKWLIPVAARSKAWVCGLCIGGTAGSNPGGDMDVCLLWKLCVFRQSSLCLADHSSRGVLPIVVCLNVI